MRYSSPFQLVDEDHDSVDPLCLSRAHHHDPEAATWEECYEAAVALSALEAPQFAFWAARQLAELGLKRLVGPGYPPTHDLARLMELVPQLSNDDAETRAVRSFILDLHRVDPHGDGGRYPTDRAGQPALSAVCCIERDVLLGYVRALHAYVEFRVSSRC